MESHILGIKFPAFVKPNNGGSSYGITKVKKQEELLPALIKAFEEGGGVLVEECVTGRELTCGVYTRVDEIGEAYTSVIGITESISETEFLDYEAKYEGKSVDILLLFFNYTSTSLSGNKRLYKSTRQANPLW